MTIINGRRWAIAMAIAAALANPGERARAQRALPLSDDALVLGFGQFRSGVHGQWQFYDQVYGDDGKLQTYGSALSSVSTGTAQFSMLANGESGIRDASGQSAFQLSLGATDVSATHRMGSTALLLDVGLPGRFMLSVEVPFVRVETTVNVTANNGITTPANVGVNPALASTSLFASDTSLANQIARARTALNAQLASCLGSTAASCSTVNARRAEAQTLVATSAVVSAGILTIASSPFAPLATSTTQAAITARIAALANTYRDFGINTITGTTTAPASAPLTAGQYREFLASSAFGPNGSLPSYKSLTRLGDINVGAKFRITDTERIRAAAFGRVYFPTGGEAGSGELLPISGSEGSTRTELGGIADLFAATKLSLTAAASSEIWLANDMTVRSNINDNLGPSLLPGVDVGVGRSFVAHRERRTGMNISVTPRYAFNRWMTVGAQYGIRTLSAERFTLDGRNVAVFNRQGATTEHRIGAGFSFSNLSTSRSSGPRFPLEASFFHSQTISGKGFQPKVFNDEFRIRIFGSR